MNTETLDKVRLEVNSRLGVEYRRQWRKVHLGIGAKTLEIRAIEVTDNSIGDAPMLPQQLGQIASEEPIASVSADGAYDTKGCHAAIVQRGAQAVIPPRKNGQPWKANLPERSTATKRSELVEDWAGAFGKNGVAITAGAWSKPRCTASSVWASA